jgi:hypothetical protein
LPFAEERQPRTGLTQTTIIKTKKLLAAILSPPEIVG